MNRPLLLALGLILATAAVDGATARPAQAASDSGVLTAEAQAALTPAAVLEDLKAGNKRFVDGQMTHRDYHAQVEATAKGQFPKAAILGCLDSRVPVEVVFDQGIGDVFVGRVAGNFENVDLLGSLEFATAAAGSRVIVVLGHSACGAIKGAVDGVEMGNLTAMLDNFDGSIEAARSRVKGDVSSSNQALVAAVVEENVRQTVKDIVDRSPVIADLVKQGQVAVVGGVYDLSSGQVTWLD